MSFIYFVIVSGEIIYIGRSSSIIGRCIEHFNNYDKCRIRVINCQTRDRSIQYEKRAIAYFRPIKNIKSNPDWVIKRFRWYYKGVHSSTTTLKPFFS